MVGILYKPVERTSLTKEVQKMINVEKVTFINERI